MSQPPTSIPPPSQPPPHLPLLPFPTPTTVTNREYRKGNWTIQETLTLITAKKLDDERRSKPSSVASTSKPGELRWKWVENYCWDHGCYRSQNQCNDKWDNLLRDYKKVREYQSRSDGSDSFPSYWTMERQQRKYYNLPSNMSVEVYEALNQVVQRRYPNITTPQNVAVPSQQQPQPQPPQQVSVVATTSATPATAREVVPEGVVDRPAISGGGGSESSATESSDRNDSSGTKRRKVKNNIGASIKHSASILAQTIRSSEEKKDKRHQQLMEFEQRRLQLEETKNEVNRQGMANLAMAVTNLSTAIQSLISDQT